MVWIEVRISVKANEVATYDRASRLPRVLEVRGRRINIHILGLILVHAGKKMSPVEAAVVFLQDDVDRLQRHRAVGLVDQQRQKTHCSRPEKRGSQAGLLCGLLSLDVVIHIRRLSVQQQAFVTQSRPLQPHPAG